MNTKTMLGALLAAAALGMPPIASAQAMAGHDAMAGGHMAPATMICRPATGKEHGNAMMAQSRQMMMCKPLAPSTAEGKTGPDIAKALTPAQVNAAWQQWVNVQFDIPATGGG
jgi:hypothetical protein